MDPARKRRFRFVFALSAALVLAGALAWTSFSSASAARSPSQLAAASEAGEVYELTGKVEGWQRDGNVHTFRVRDREGEASIPVRYEGAVPDPFRNGREIIVDVRKQGAGFVGEPDSLVTKCPSKFTAEKQT